jgi:muramidase (phage lysozyme)
MAFLSELYRPRPLIRPLLYPQTDAPASAGSATDPSGASPGGSMAALMTPNPIDQGSTSPEPGWSPFFGSPPAAPAPSLDNALDALAAMLGIGAAPASSTSAGAGDQPLLQLTAARGAGRSAPPVATQPPFAANPPNALPGDPFATPGLTNALDPITAPSLTNLQQRELDLDNPFAKSLLTLLAQTEGATYNSLYRDQLAGKRKIFSDYSRYPRASTRSGQYQIQQNTYDRTSTELGLKDYSPHTQDLLALQLVADRGAMPALLTGDLDTVLPLIAPEWASLPKGKDQMNAYPPQPFTPYDRVRTLFDLYSWGFAHSPDSPF